MSFESQPINATAGADLSAKLHRFGKRDTDGKIVVCSTLGERADGIIGSKPTAEDDGMDLFIDRLMPIRAGGAFDGGAKLTTDANGRAVLASTGHHVMAIATEPATTEDQEVACTPVFGSLPAASVSSIVAIAAPGAIPPTADYVLLSVDGTDAFTLAAGEEGHEITIDCIEATNTPIGTLTLAAAYGSEGLTHVFRAAGQKLKFVMTSTGWKLIEKKRAGSMTVVVGTTVLTGEDLVATYNLSVTGTVSSTTTKAIPDGMVEGEEIDVQVTTAATSPDGEIGIVAVDADAAPFTLIDTIDGTTGHNAHFRWNGAAWRNTSINGVVLA